MDAEKVAFWGIVLKPGDPADLDLDDGETLRVTTASYGEELGDKAGRSVITASVRPDDDAEPKRFAVAVLTAGKTETITMDVAFVGEEKVTFEVSGKNAVHLVGNFSFENDLEEDDSDEDEEDNHLIGLYDDTMESESEDEEDEQGAVKPIKEDKPIITELPDEDEDDNKVEEKVSTGKRKKGKKDRIANGGSDAVPTKKVSDAAAEPISKSKKAVPGKEEDGKPEATEKAGSHKSGSKGRRRKSGHKKDLVDGSEPTAATKDTDAKDLEKKSDESNKTVTRSALNKILDSKKAAPSDDVVKDDAEDGGNEGDGEHEVKETPQKSKKRRRKHSVTVEVPEKGPSPPSGKKSKVSQRPATPAPSKTAAHVKSPADQPEKANGQTDLNGKAEAAKESDANTPSATPGSAKKKRRSKKKRAA